MTTTNPAPGRQDSGDFMDFLDFLGKRKSIRHFLPDPVSDETITHLLEAGRLAPSRANSQPWCFVVVRDAEVKRAIYNAVYHQEVVLEAPVLIVVLGVIDPRPSVPARTLELVQAGAFGMDVKIFADHVLDNWNEHELRTDSALNAAIAGTHIMLAAHAFGLGCCWVKLCDDQIILEVLKVPDGYYNAGILAIGHADEDPPQRPRLPLSDMVHRDRFSAPQEDISQAAEEADADNSPVIAHPAAEAVPDADIERMKTELTVLRVMEARLRSILYGVADAVIFADAAGLIRIMNPAAETLTGWGEDEAAGEALGNVFRISDDRVLQSFYEPFARTDTEDGSIAVLRQTGLIARDGTERIISMSSTCFRDERGRLSGSVFIFRDVTSEKRAEMELLAYKDQLETLVVERTERIRELNIAISQSVDGIILTELDGKIKFVNNAWAGMHGFCADELTGQHIRIFHTQEQYEQEVRPSLERMQANGSYEGEIGHLRKDGSLFLANMTASFVKDADGTSRGMLVVARDITERKRVEEELRKERQRLDFYINSSPMCTIEWDADYTVTRWAGEAENIFGWTGEETVGKPIMDLRMIYEDDLPIVENTMRQLSGGAKYVVAVNRNYTKDRSVITCEWYNTVLTDSEGRMSSVLSQVLDITKRRKAEESLLESETRFRGAFEYSAIGMALVSPKGKWLKVNPALCEMLGYSEEELLAKTFQDITHPDDLEADLEYVRQMLAGEIKAYTMEKRYFHKRGDVVYVLLAVSLVRNGKGEPLHFISQIENITERKQAEEARLNLERQLLHTQKLESLGILAGGVAHDFNNILTAIIGNAELTMMRLPPGSPLLDNLQQIEKSSARAADLARQMLAYSGRGRFMVETIDLNRLLEEMLHLLEISVAKSVLLRLDLHRPIPPITADSAQMRQVIMNLVINASEATADKSGVITIGTGAIRIEEGQVAAITLGENLCGGEYVFLEVTDSGCGMTKETVAKIFDPFFTTKFTGRGLGMSAVQGIVRGHKGAIQITSEPEKGSCFRVLLPASVTQHEVQSTERREESWHGSGKVLLIDDEEAVRGIAEALLRELGFTVVTAVNGRDGIDVFMRNRDIAFVILDLTMPVMGGEECFGALKEIDPAVKVIISSGYSVQEVVQMFSGRGMAGFIQKPYRLNVLRDVLQKTLNSIAGKDCR